MTIGLQFHFVGSVRSELITWFSSVLRAWVIRMHDTPTDLLTASIVVTNDVSFLDRKFGKDDVIVLLSSKVETVKEGVIVISKFSDDDHERIARALTAKCP